MNNVCKPQTDRAREKTQKMASDVQSSVSAAAQHDQLQLMETLAALHWVTSALCVAAATGLRESEQGLYWLSPLRVPSPVYISVEEVDIKAHIVNE